MVLLSARERILMIRLLEQAAKHPAYAQALGIEGAEMVRRAASGAAEKH